MTTTAERQEYAFQAEIKQVLHLLAHSLYQSKEIAIRELVSNASDALDKMRHISLTDPNFREIGTLEIRIERDESNSILTIVDNGIGMTHDECVKNLGTIAHSGSLDFAKNITGDQKKDLSLIGQFGVGFYSSFMLADRVRVRTRSYKEESGWEWESDGSGAFTVAAADVAERGTRVILHLKDDVKEFLQEIRLKGVLQKYSNFVPYPIKLEDKLVNEVKPIWVEPKNQLTPEQYKGFYQHLTHRTSEDPLWHLHFSADSPIQFHALLYCPPSNFEMLGFGRLDHGIHLCAKRILVQSDNRELLPEYLRFLQGLVDSEDLPLNVSRESLQDSSVFRKIRGTLVKKLLDRMGQLAEEKPDDYMKFYRMFGNILKEGVGSDFENKGRIAKLLRFPSSNSTAPDAVTSFDDYVKRMPESQKDIYYTGGFDLASIRKSPNLEIFAKRGLEVLFLVDPIDEFVIASLSEYEGKALKSIDSADLELPETAKEEEKKEEKPAEPVAGPGFARVLEIFKNALGDKIKDVRESKRLTDSPCCLVNPDGSVSTQMQKLLRMANKDFPISKRILEINPRAPLIQRLTSLTANPAHETFIRKCGEQLFANALILEGMFQEPEETVDRVQTFMETAAEKLSPIIT